MTDGPIFGASDYVSALPDLVRPWIPTGKKFVTLGTDGFGMSDTRAALRDYFGISADAIAQRVRSEFSHNAVI
jgi:pyruvate dehydrogenase E1 component